MKKSMLQGLIWRSLFFGANFFFNVAFARFFGSALSGSIYLVVNTLSIFILITSVNIESGIGYYAALNKNDNYNALGLLITIVSAILLFLISALPIAANLFTAPNWPWYGSYFYVVGNILVSIFSVLFFAKGNYVLPNLVLAITSFVVAILYIFANKWNISTSTCLQIFFWYNLLQGVIMLVFYLAKTSFQLTISNLFNTNTKQVFSFSFVSLIDNLVFFLLYRMDFWLVDHFCTSAALGNYAQVSKFGQLLLIAPTIFASVVQPRITDGSIKVFSKTASLAFLTIVVLGVASFLFILFFGPFFFQTILGKEFDEMYWPSLLKIPAIMFLSLHFVLGTWFSANNLVRYNLYCTLAGLAMIAILDYLLIPTYGIIGASAASLIAYFGVFAVTVYCYHFKAKQSFGDLIKMLVAVLKNWRGEVTILFKAFR